MQATCVRILASINVMTGKIVHTYSGVKLYCPDDCSVILVQGHGKTLEIAKQLRASSKASNKLVGAPEAN